MQAKRHVALFLGVLSVLSVLVSSGCDLPIVTEVLNEKDELAAPVLIFSVLPEKSKVFSKTFSIQHSGKYTVELSTVLKNGEIKRYELPDENSNLVGEFSIYGESREFIKHAFDIDLPPKIIGRGLFGVKAPKKLPLEEVLTFEIVLSEISDSFFELYDSITIVIKRQGVLYD